jgi:Rrf2 family protein
LTGKVEMRISKRGEYALRALIDIGIATELGKPLVQIDELASQEKLPVRFLEQILMQLRGGGFISSMRGKRGGYHLRNAIAGIMDRHSLADIVDITLRKMKRDRVPLAS